MTQHQLNCEIAHKTGESLREIRRRGFSLADPIEADFDVEPNQLRPASIDWDNLDNRGLSLFPRRQRRTTSAISTA